MIKRNLNDLLSFVDRSPNPQKQNPDNLLGYRGFDFEMERAKRLELSTSTLARWCSTN